MAKSRQDCTRRHGAGCVHTRLPAGSRQAATSTKLLQHSVQQPLASTPSARTGKMYGISNARWNRTHALERISGSPWIFFIPRWQQ